MSRKNPRGLSGGTVIMLSLVLLVLAGTAYVWARLSGGQVDLTQSARGILQLVSEGGTREEEDIQSASSAGGQEGQAEHSPANPTSAAAATVPPHVWRPSARLD